MSDFVIVWRPEVDPGFLEKVAKHEKIACERKGCAYIGDSF